MVFNRNAINHWYGIFRRVIYAQQIALKKQLVGNIEVDESYFGAKRVCGFYGKLKRGSGTLKQPVFGIFERDGRVYTEIVPDARNALYNVLYRIKSLLRVLYTVMGGAAITV